VTDDAVGVERDAASPVCSAKGCRAEATWVLGWNNPRLHRPQRRKAWTACDGHKEHLTQFLEARGFLRQVVPIGDWRRVEAG
jgi:hypothetical protein